MVSDGELGDEKELVGEPICVLACQRIVTCQLGAELVHRSSGPAP
jgi:hypothetical protein